VEAADLAVAVAVAAALAVHHALEGDRGEAALGELAGGAVAQGAAEAAAGAVGVDQGGPTAVRRGAGGQGEAEAGVDRAALDRDAALEVDASADLRVRGDALLEDRQAHPPVDLAVGRGRGAAATLLPLLVGEAGRAGAGALAGGLAQVEVVDEERGGARGLAGAGEDGGAVGGGEHGAADQVGGGDAELVLGAGEELPQRGEGLPRGPARGVGR